MREIKFRGKRLDDGEWVYGELQIGDDDHIPMIGILGPCRWVEYIQVRENTISEFTGLKDKKGDDIFEGDILKSGHDDRLYVVKFWSGMFYASVEECNKGIFGGFPLHALTENEESGYECDIIGNIHDDPELLKTE